VVSLDLKNGQLRGNSGRVGNIMFKYAHCVVTSMHMHRDRDGLHLSVHVDIIMYTVHHALYFEHEIPASE